MNPRRAVVLLDGRRLRQSAAQPRDKLFGWSATAKRMSRVLAELV